MPSSAGPIWLLTGLVLIAFPTLNFIYWPQVLRSGVLPPDGGSIDIPMFGSILATIVVSPLVLGIAWLCLRHYNPETRIGALRHDRPYRSMFVTSIFGGAAACLAIGSLLDAGTALPWYEYLWSAYSILCAAWLLALRAGFVDQEDASGES